MLTLTPAERSALRSEAHALDPVVMIGDSGLTAAVLKEIEASLNAHGLIKVRVLGDDRDERISHYETICEKLDAAPVQHIGKILVVYRPKPLPPAAPDPSATGKKPVRKSGKKQQRRTKRSYQAR